jgi:ATP-dependent exoDNAse (exonuclease V) alpha subunit
MQGCEVENDQQLIIYIDGMFDYNLFYTALSRAKRIDQIFIIISEKLV